MNPAKRFLLRLFGVYLVLSIGIIWIWGPPGMSRGYLAEYGTDHDHYLEIVKWEEYQLHLENPRLHPAEGKLEEALTFVRAYEERAAFQAEEHRSKTFGVLSECLNAVVVVLLAVRFGWKPLMGFLDQEIAKVRTTIQRAEEARAAAARQRDEAQRKLDGLDEEKGRIAAQADELIRQEQTASQEATEQGLAQIDRETKDRARREEVLAAMQIKRELVTRSIDVLTERLKAEASAEMQEDWVNRFLEGLEKAQ